LVAVLDAQIAGHILFSAVSFEPAQPHLNVVGLAPLAVLPDCQNRGIGSRLIVEGLEMCRAAGCDAVVVLGHPPYYSRFGFVRASDRGLGNEYGADDAFMLIEFKRGALDGLKATVKYQPEFAEAGA
jgi:putative acetyltransferase